MQGSFNLQKEWGLDKLGIEMVPYRERVVKHGINFMHCPLAGNDQPISGLHVPYKAMQKFVGHIVFGHYHRSELSGFRRTDREGVQRAISVPSFFVGQPHYLSNAAPVVKHEGVVILKVGKNGFPSAEEISMEELYG